MFDSLTPEELYYLVGDKNQITYKPGEIIIKQNTTSTYAICIREGIAKMYADGLNGKNFVIKLINKLDFVTGGDLFDGNLHRITISAITPVTCCLIDSEKLISLFAKKEEFAAEILKYHTNQSNELLRKLINLTQKYMPGRVADTLLYLKNEICKSNLIDIPLSRKDMAEMSNMTPESFVRILKDFKNSGHIKTHVNTIEIVEENALLSISKNG